MWSRLTCAAVGAAAMLGSAGTGHAAITVLGGGYAQACSEAALGGEVEKRFETSAPWPSTPRSWT